MAETLVWISGASSGIGRALADTVPFDDARVIDISRSGAPGLEHVAADLSQVSGWQAAAESFAKELASFQGERAVFVHCAATLTPIGFSGEEDPAGYAQQVLLNSASPQILGDAFIRAVDDRDLDSHLLILTSGAATSVYEGWSAYGAGKAAVEQWVRIVGAERARRGSRCRIVAVAPGVVETPMQEQIRETPEEEFPAVGKFIDRHESGELVPPEEAARGIWALLDRDLENGAVVDLRELD
ncbi:MAG: SDR family NAD(P)-dependent oxidoreductase [Nitriliruptorales bacterium]